MSKLHIFNSLTKKKEEFKPIQEGHVGLYVCGPTVYSYVHLGNCRTFVSFDMVNRYLKYLGYKVRYVRNITDVGHLESDADQGEDKISKKARLEQLEPMEIVQKYTVDFRDVMSKFNALPPSIEPTATGHLIEQIQMVQEILDNGYAYESNGSVYFDVEKYNQDNGYGELSGRKIEDLMAGSRELEGQEEKRNPIDFAIWKKASEEHIMRWPSPWSDGFPGWHLECSAMSTKYLGDTFDIHGGGMDLKFPHHECEIAQGCAATGKKPVNYWMHANMLTLNGKKMSKSTGNTLSPAELFSGENDKLEKAYSPTVVRFFMMQAHYSSELDFSSAAISAAEKGFIKLMTAYGALQSLEAGETSSRNVQDYVDSFYQAMNDDFNSPILIANLFEAAKFINSVKAGSETISKADLDLLQKEFKGFIFDVLGLVQESEGTNSKIDEVMSLLMEIRAEARAKKDWATSDLIRDRLQDAGITIKDSKEGTSWTY